MAQNFNRKIYIEYEELSASDLPKHLAGLLQVAEKAALNAYAPYSAFKVGAAVLLDDNSVVVGNNQENAAYPSGLCAERVALYAAKAQFPNKTIKALAVTAQSGAVELTSPVSPCGACRQVMAEYEAHNQKQSIQVILGGFGDRVWLLENATCLLPLTFTGEGVRKKNNL